MISRRYGHENDKTFYVIENCGEDIYFCQYFNGTQRCEKYHFFDLWQRGMESNSVG
jgi:hypothetical protein